MESLETADDTIELAAEYELLDGAQLSESQQIRLRNGMGERADGRWAAKRVGDFGGRQGAGKTGVVLVRIFGGLFIVGERLIIYTAHEFPTANEVFIRVGAVLESWDDLRGLVLAERRAHGDQSFELKGPKGAELTEKRRLLFKTRTGKSGRGFAKADLIVYDEAQHLKREQIAGSGPARLANPNSQSWWSGSGGFGDSEPAWEMRRQAIMGTGGRLAYAEHTAETWRMVDGRPVFDAPDFQDRRSWYLANPGLGDWVSEDDFADLVIELGELAPRELGCIWEPDATDVVPSELPHWAEIADPASTVDRYAAWSLAVSPLESGPQWACFGLAGRRVDGRFHVEALDHRAGVWWVVDRAKEIYAARRIPLRVRSTGAEGALIAQLIEAGVKVEQVSALDASQACGAFIAAADFDDDGTPLLHHLDDPDLNKAVRVARRKASAGGSSTWDELNSPTEISPLIAVSVALGGVPSDVRPPRIWALTPKG